MRRGIVGLGLVTAMCVCLSAAAAIAGHAAPSANTRLVIFSSPGIVVYISPAGTGDPRHVKTATGIRCGGQCSRVFPVATKVTVKLETKSKREKGVFFTTAKGKLSVKACEGKTTCSFVMPARTRTYLGTVFCFANLSLAQCRAYIAKTHNYPPP